MPDQPSVFLLTNSFPYGNSEPYLVNELEVYRNLKLNISIVPLNIPKDTEQLDEYNGFRVLNIATGNYSISGINLRTKLFLARVHAADLLRSSNLKYIFSNYKTNYSLLLRLFHKTTQIQKVISEKATNSTLYCYWCSDIATIAGFLKRENRNYRIISRGHGFDVFRDQSRHGHLSFKYFQLQHLDQLYSVSVAGENELKKVYPYYQKKIDKSYLGVKSTGLGPFDKNSFAIVTCSHVREIKRLHLMPEILKNINIPLTWHVLGDGPELSKLKLACGKLPPNIKVVFYGNLTQEQIFSFYKTNGVNLFVSLSSSEGLPVSMMEAISFGIPLLATDVGGCNEICTEDTGILIDKNFSAPDVANKIVTFSRSEKNTGEFRKKVRRYWENNFDAENNYKRFAEILVKPKSVINE